MKAGQKSTIWKWNQTKESAAQMLAQDEFTIDEIVIKLGIDRKTIYNWKKRPEFQARVEEHVQEFGDAKMRYAIANRNRRLRNLNDRLERLHQVIRDRAADPSMQDVPGGKTGLMVRTVKSVGSGPAAQVVEEYEVDTGVLKEAREHEKQAAIECGQWTEKKDLTTGGQPFKIYAGFSPDDV